MLPKPPPIVAPDIGILLAIGFGSQTDTQAPEAEEAMAAVLESNAERVLLHTVDEECSRKIERISDVIAVLRGFESGFTEANPQEGPLDVLERVSELVRRDNPGLQRLINWAEQSVANHLAAAPGTTGREAIRIFLWALAGAKSATQTRIDAIGLKKLPGARSHSPRPTPSLPGVTGYDLKHVIAAEELGRERKKGVVFLVLDGNIQAHRTAISQELPWVRVSNRTFLAKYLSDDATGWGNPERPKPELDAGPTSTK